MIFLASGLSDYFILTLPICATKMKLLLYNWILMLFFDIYFIFNNLIIPKKWMYVRIILFVIIILP